MKIVASLLSRLRRAPVASTASTQSTPPLTPAPRDPVAQAYVRFGPRVARAVARSTREKGSQGGPSLWALV